MTDVINLFPPAKPEKPGRIGPPNSERRPAGGHTPRAGSPIPAGNDAGYTGDNQTLRSVPKWASNDVEGFCFEVYQTDVVALTSILKAGGEWRWRLCAPDMTILAASAGYVSEGACLSAVDALRNGARSASFRRITIS